MTFTYASTDLSTTLAQVRLTIGDTNSADPLLTDEEINYAILSGGSVNSSAAIAADWISAKFARLADKSVGDLSISQSQKAKQYADLSARLRRDVARGALP